MTSPRCSSAEATRSLQLSKRLAFGDEMWWYHLRRFRLFCFIGDLTPLHFHRSTFDPFFQQVLTGWWVDHINDWENFENIRLLSTRGRDLGTLGWLKCTTGMRTQCLLWFPGRDMPPASSGSAWFATGVGVLWISRKCNCWNRFFWPLGILRRLCCVFSYTVQVKFFCLQKQLSQQSAPLTPPITCSNVLKHPHGMIC